MYLFTFPSRAFIYRSPNGKYRVNGHAIIPPTFNVPSTSGGFFARTKLFVAIIVDRANDRSPRNTDYLSTLSDDRAEMWGAVFVPRTNVELIASELGKPLDNDYY